MAVRAGLADAGMAIRTVADLAGMDFLPVARETFKLAVPGTYMGHRRVGGFLDVVLEEFANAARRRVAGYSFDTTGRMRPVAHIDA